MKKETPLNFSSLQRPTIIKVRVILFPHSLLWLNDSNWELATFQGWFLHALEREEYTFERSAQFTSEMNLIRDGMVAKITLRGQLFLAPFREMRIVLSPLDFIYTGWHVPIDFHAFYWFEKNNTTCISVCKNFLFVLNSVSLAFLVFISHCSHVKKTNSVFRCLKEVAGSPSLWSYAVSHPMIFLLLIIIPTMSHEFSQFSTMRFSDFIFLFAAPLLLGVHQPVVIYITLDSSGTQKIIWILDYIFSSHSIIFFKIKKTLILRFSWHVVRKSAMPPPFICPAGSISSKPIKESLCIFLCMHEYIFLEYESQFCHILCSLLSHLWLFASHS